MSIQKTRNISNAGRKKGASNCPFRGLRLSEEMKKKFGNVSRRAISLVLGVSDNTIKGWEEGRNIDNKALAKMMDVGMDVPLILGARKSPGYEPGEEGSAGVKEINEPRPIFEADPACRQGQLCVQLSMLLRLLLDTLARASRDETKRAEIAATLERIAAELRRCVAG